MARNHKFFFDADRTPRARGPAAEKILMHFLETDVQGSDHVCHDLMDDLVAVEDGSDDQREFVGEVHRVTMDREGVVIETLPQGGDGAEAATGQATGQAPGTPGEAMRGGTVYRTGRKHFREVLEDWEAFILDDELDDDSLDDDDFT